MSEWVIKVGVKPPTGCRGLPNKWTHDQLKQSIKYWKAYLEAVKSHHDMPPEVKRQEGDLARFWLDESMQALINQGFGPCPGM